VHPGAYRVHQRARRESLGLVVGPGHARQGPWACGSRKHPSLGKAHSGARGEAQGEVERGKVRFWQAARLAAKRNEEREEGAKALDAEAKL
jgi:hypothetical protein